MRIAKRPAQRNIHGAVTLEDGAIIAAAGDSVLHWDVVLSRELDSTVDVFARRDVGIVYRANDKSLADFGVGKTLRFQWRVRADERIDGENKVGRLAFLRESFCHGCGAL